MGEGGRVSPPVAQMLLPPLVINSHTEVVIRAPGGSRRILHPVAFSQLSF